MAALSFAPTANATAIAATHACRVEGFASEVQCGSLQRPLDPQRANGPQIAVHYVIVPAMARNKQPDAVLLLAGGPGQSAIGVAPGILSLLGRLNYRRDLVFIDQRGTGQSAPLQCPDESRLPLQQVLDETRQIERLRQCAMDLAKLPYGADGGLRFFTTTIAMQDMEAVRQHLGVPQWNLIGASYGTRAALEYLRQFPTRVRRTVIDGVAPPDMLLPLSGAEDAQAALDAVFKACETDTTPHHGCAQQFPQLRQQWSQLQASLPRQIVVNHPLTGKPERVELTRDALLRSVRSPLYVPALTSGLPSAIHTAAQDDFTALVGLSSAMGGMGGGKKSTRLAYGMHFSVVCSEDVARMESAQAAIKKEAVPTKAKPPDDGARLYREVCAFWPRGQVDTAFFTIPPSPSPVLVLSGGADPVTPPRHGERTSKALGAKAQHVVVRQAGHGVMGVGCMRDVVVRFVTAKDADALPQDTACASVIPRPMAFVPLGRTEPAPAATK